MFQRLQTPAQLVGDSGGSFDEIGQQADRTEVPPEVAQIPNSQRLEAMKGLSDVGGLNTPRPAEVWAREVERHHEEIVGAWTDALSSEEMEEVERAADEVRDEGAETDSERATDSAADLGAGGGPLPHHEEIQAAFGPFSLLGVRAQVGGPAAGAAEAMNADGFTNGAMVGLLDADPWTAAHEAAHAVQQSGGLSLPGGEGHADDHNERHADAVADRVVRGQSAVDLLSQVADPGPVLDRPAGIQRSGDLPSPPLSDDKLRGLSKEQLQELYNRMRKTHPQEALKVKKWQKTMEYRGSSVKKGGASKKSMKKTAQELAEEGGEEVTEKVGKKLFKKGAGFIARKFPIVAAGFFLYDWAQGGFGHAVNELTWPASELWTD